MHTLYYSDYDTTENIIEDVVSDHENEAIDEPSKDIKGWKISKKNISFWYYLGLD